MGTDGAALQRSVSYSFGGWFNFITDYLSHTILHLPPPLLHIFLVNFGAKTSCSFCCKSKCAWSIMSCSQIIVLIQRAQNLTTVTISEHARAQAILTSMLILTHQKELGNAKHVLSQRHVARNMQVVTCGMKNYSRMFLLKLSENQLSCQQFRAG